MWFRNFGLLLCVRKGVCPDGISLKDNLWVYYRGGGRDDCYLQEISGLKCFEYHLVIDLASHFSVRTES